MTSSTNRQVQRVLDALPACSWISLDEVSSRVTGSREAVRFVLVRDTRERRLVHVRRDLWWKPGGWRRLTPHPWEVAQEVLRRSGTVAGFGPSGDAARWFLADAPVPELFVVAVVGRPPSACGTVRFVGRQAAARARLLPPEVAALELLREGDLPALIRGVDLAAVADAATRERPLELQARGQALKRQVSGS